MKIRSEVSVPLPAQVSRRKRQVRVQGEGWTGYGVVEVSAHIRQLQPQDSEGWAWEGRQNKEGRPHLEVGVGDRGKAGDLGVPAAKGKVFPGGKRDWPPEAVSRGHWWPCQEQSGVTRAERSRDIGMPTLVGLPAASTVSGPTLSAGNDKV